MVDQGKLAHYATLVRTWSTRLDLVSPRDLERFETRHIADSLRLLPLLADAPEGPFVDVGSGAGLPGIPLAIASGRPWRLIEPRTRRAAFLDEVVRALELDCEVVPRTAEDAARDPRYRAVHALAVARAFAPPTQTFTRLGPLVRGDGIVAVFHGPRARLPRDAEEWAPGIATIGHDRPSTREEM